MLPKIEIGSDGADSPVSRRIVTPAFCLWDLRRSSSYGQIRESWNSSFLLLTPLIYTSLSTSCQFFFSLFVSLFSDVCDLNLQITTLIIIDKKKHHFFLLFFKELCRIDTWDTKNGVNIFDVIFNDNYGLSK